MSNSNTAIYSRVAQADEYRIRWQEEKLLQYAKLNGHNDCVFYRDNGTSGMSLDRPGMKNLIHDIQDGIIGTVIVADQNRVARDYMLMRKWFMFLAKYGIVFLSVAEEQQAS